MSSNQNRRVALCASCDRCRSRKTKCDGNRPCGNCASKYMKKHRLTSIVGVDPALFECVYSPAKRRGPVPGKSGGRKADAANLQDAGKGNKSNLMRMDMAGYGNGGVNQQGLAALVGQGVNAMGMNQLGQGMGSDAFSLQQQLLMQQQQQLNGMAGMNGLASMSGMNGLGGDQNLMLQQQLLMQQMLNGGSTGSLNNDDGGNRAQRIKKEEAPPDSVGVDKSLPKHLPLLEKSSAVGNRLRAHYSLAIDTLFKLPPVPSDEEYCSKLNANMTPAMLPPFDIAALRAARFAEIALGALVSNQIPLALELSNATVVCLKKCVEEPVHPNCMFDVAKSYFLHGLFRSYRGDMERYFKYRRVCMSKVTHLGKDSPGISQLLAAISFHDAWAYMIYNANADDLPNIDDIIPQIPSCGKPALSSEAEQKYQTSTAHADIASDPINKMWIQGTPPVFINNEAPPLSRCLDGLACAIRSCCDQANHRFDEMGGGGSCAPSATSLAVTANTNELCSRNMVLSAFTLLQQSENASDKGSEKNHGHHLLVSVMDAFLEAGDDSNGGFTDSQIQSMLTVCNTIIEKPYLLYQAGITYHMISNTAIMLCHLLNGLYSKQDELGEGETGEMEAALFDEVLDTYIAVRKMIVAHRRKLPMLLRCHGLPRPKLLKLASKKGREPGAPFIDLADTHMCASRSCQGFVLMACSPCVAAERARDAATKHKEEMDALANGEGNYDDLGAGFDDSLLDIDDLDLDDDALLGVLGKIIGP